MNRWLIWRTPSDAEATVVEADSLKIEGGCLIFRVLGAGRDENNSLLTAFSPHGWARCEYSDTTKKKAT